MSASKEARPKRGPRDKYSRLICIGCRDRRIRCELPDNVDIPKPGELRTIQTPCYRCKRLGIPCVIRQTVLGRPGPGNNPTAAAAAPAAGHVVPRLVIDLSSLSRKGPHAPRGAERDEKPAVSLDQRRAESWKLLHTPQSGETILIIRALDTMHCQHVEEEWFRHLPTYAGRSHTLDLSIKAIVAACAYARGVPKLTTRDCYQALSLALHAVQVSIQESHGQASDDILASTALLSPFEGVMRKRGGLTRLHVDGMAAMLEARSVTDSALPLARDIFDFYNAESAIMACVQGTPSPFENVPRGYFANDRMGCSDGDRVELSALSNELYLRIPRLLMLVRALRIQQAPQDQHLLAAVRFSRSLLRLQDSEAEGRLLSHSKLQLESDPVGTTSLHQSFHFTSVKNFEALAWYWTSRLFLLRLDWRLRSMLILCRIQKVEDPEQSGEISRPNLGPIATEMSRLAKNIVMCREYARTLQVRKRNRLFAHAMVIVWGATTDVPIADNGERDEQEPGHFSDLLIQSANLALSEAQPNLTAEDMDIAADIFAGGQLTGKFAELYSSLYEMQAQPTAVQRSAGK